MADTMQGRRIECPFSASGGLEGEWPQAGDYYLFPDVGWQACTPNGLMATLTAHTVTEHEDKTITVSPSIYVNRGMTPEWHGYLERGVWRQC